jgi:hypothetical protein
VAPVGIGREVLFRWSRYCSREMIDAPHLLVVGVGNSLFPGPVQLRQEAKWGHGGGGDAIGGEIFTGRGHRVMCLKLNLSDR